MQIEEYQEKSSEPPTFGELDDMEFFVLADEGNEDCPFLAVCQKLSDTSYGTINENLISVWEIGSLAVEKNTKVRRIEIVKILVKIDWS